MTSFRCDEEILRTGDDGSSDDVVELKITISKLSVENEKYRQELHKLQRELETNSNMQSELVELNEALEQSLKDREAVNRRIHEAEDKQIAEKKLLQEKLEEAEAELEKKSKENQELRQTLKDNKEKLLALRQVDSSVSSEDNSEILRCEIERLLELLEQESATRKHLEEVVEAVQSESNELRQILTATKGQLAEKEEILESTRDNLSCCRMELETMKTAPVSDTCKGNSLFAEVEDRRKKTMEQMNAMRNSYLKAKRSFQAKEAEIKALKAERAMLLRKWENDTVEKIQQDTSLCDKYRGRIADLERQLKEEQKKQKQAANIQQTPDDNYSFMRDLVDTKKKEVEELQMKIENDAIHALLEEEMKHKLGKQLRYWRHRAMSNEVELLSIKNRLESDPSSSDVEILATIESCLKKQTAATSDENFISVEPSYRETTIVNETVMNLENFINIPRGFNSFALDSTLTGSQNMEEKIRAMDATTATSQDMEQTVCETDAASTKPQDVESTVCPMNATSTRSQDMEETVCVVRSIAGEISSVNQDKFLSSQDMEETACVVRSIAGEISSVKQEKISPSQPIISAGTKIPKPTSIKTVSRESIDTREKSAASEDHGEKPQRKTLRFTDDTIDPPGKPLKKQTSTKPNYPIIFISSGPPKSKRSEKRD